MEKIKEFFKTKVGQQIYSFIKTYITVFIGIYLTLQGVFADTNLQMLSDMNLTDVSIVGASARGACISVLRNIYKLMTE